MATCRRPDGAAADKGSIAVQGVWFWIWAAVVLAWEMTFGATALEALLMAGPARPPLPAVLFWVFYPPLLVMLLGQTIGWAFARLR
jgi:hypothetical protein